MENGFDTVTPFGGVDEALIIGVHTPSRGDKRATIYIADWQPQKTYPLLAVVYTQEYDSYEELMRRECITAATEVSLS